MMRRSTQAEVNLDRTAHFVVTPAPTMKPPVVWTTPFGSPVEPLPGSGGEGVGGGGGELRV